MEDAQLSEKTMACFKYRSGAAALRCLDEGSLYFARPDQLNDMLEAKYDFADSGESALRMLQAVIDISGRRQEIPIEMPAELKYDLVGETEKENKRLKEFTDQIGIFSAAQSPDNQAMWAYYADDFKGMCFELEWDDDVVSDNQVVITSVLYSDSSRVVSRAEVFEKCLGRLSESNPGVSVEQLMGLSLSERFRRGWGIECAAYAVSIKHSDWQHEQEIRLLAPRAGAKVILSDVLRRVHFVRTDGKEWGGVMRLLYEKYPNVELVKWDFHHGEITKSATPMRFELIRIE